MAYAPPYDAERQKQIGRTKTGLLLLLIGTILGVIPFIQIIGALLLLIGAILVILGRKAFGAAHARNVVLAIVLVFVGVIAGFVGGVIVAATIFSAATINDPDALAAAFASAFQTFLVIGIVAGAISGLGSVLFTYALQQQIGRILLWAGYVANLAVQIVIYVLVSGLIQAAIDQMGQTPDPAPFLAVQGQITNYALLSIIPALLFAAATYLAWQRVSRGEIPPPVTPPPMAAGSWPPTNPPP